MIYLIGGAVSAFLAFAAVYITAISDNGLIAGGTLGVIPAAITAIIVAIIWPIVIAFFVWKLLADDT